MKRADISRILWALLYAPHSQSLLNSDPSDPRHEPAVSPMVAVKAIPDTGELLPDLCDATDFGPNVMIFDPSMPNTFIQSQIDSVFQIQEANQFGSQRYALLFKPGNYSLNAQLGFYTTVLGLGTSPDAVTITGGMNSLAAWFEDNATQNFWRGVENIAINPTAYGNNMIWATSQGTWLRRVHVNGTLWLFDYISPGPNNWSSGGFIANSVIDTEVQSGSQQQYLTRNTDLTKWEGQLWNMVFVGDLNPPNGTWPSTPFSVVQKTPVIREKPYLTFDGSTYSVIVPSLKVLSQGPSWTAPGKCENDATLIPLSGFYIAKPNVDNTTTLNLALQRGLHLLFTPGLYALTQPIVVRNANTVIFGIGLATLQPVAGTPAIIVADVGGVTIAGLLLDAGELLSPNLLQIGDRRTTVDHSTNPTAIFDISCRVGGPAPTAQTTSCIVVNNNHVLMDNVWLWRADHGAQVSYTGWNVNPSSNGLIVNGDNVTAYGLFVEHFEGFQTLWNGEGGEVYFYQSECPYDVPSQAEWTQCGERGYPSYKVGRSVKSHRGEGIGIYCNFMNPVQLNNAIETPESCEINMNHLVTVWLNGANGSSINHLINGKGLAVRNNHTLSQSSH